MGYTRRSWSEPLGTRSFGFHRSAYHSPIYYNCGLEIPQLVIDNDPAILLAHHPNRYLYLEFGAATQNSSSVMTIAVFMESSRTNATETDHSTSFSVLSSASSLPNTLIDVVKDVKQLAFDYWCLSFRYFSLVVILLCNNCFK